MALIEKLFTKRKDYNERQNFERHEKVVSTVLEYFKKVYAFEISIADKWEIWLIAKSKLNDKERLLS